MHDSPSHLVKRMPFCSSSAAEDHVTRRLTEPTTDRDVLPCVLPGDEVSGPGQPPDGAPRGRRLHLVTGWNEASLEGVDQDFQSTSGSTSTDMIQLGDASVSQDI